MTSVRLPDVDRLVIDSEPRKLVVLGEPYLVLTARGYAPAIDVIEAKSRQKRFIYVSAASVSSELDKLRVENEGRFNGLEFWIWKESDEKSSKYKVRS